MLVERPLAEIIFRTWLRQVSWGFQYTAGRNSTFKLPCVLVSAQPSSYSKDGYILVHILIILEICLALKKQFSFFVPVN